MSLTAFWKCNHKRQSEMQLSHIISTCLMNSASTLRMSTLDRPLCSLRLGYYKLCLKGDFTLHLLSSSIRLPSQRTSTDCTLCHQYLDAILEVVLSDGEGYPIRSWSDHDWEHGQ
jgi:hypothetical protein